MRSRIIFVILAVSIMCAFMPKTVAFEQAAVLEYFSDADKVTAYISNLNNDDITCRIAGVDCTAETNGNVYSDAEMYKTLFLIDSSKSMSAYNDEISEFILECIDKKQDNEYYSISVFGSGHEPTAVIDFDNDRYSLEKAVDDVTYTFESSYIFDNLDNAIDELMNEGENCYKRIVLFTDGCENSAVGITVEDVISQINTTPISVYTVTLLDGKKSNYDQLKTVARIARESKASDIRINAETVIKNAAGTLSQDAKSISKVTIYPENVLADGSVKAVEFSSGETKITADMRMPMTTVAVETTVSETGATQTATTAEKAEEVESIDASRFVVPIAIGVAVVAVIVLIVILISGRKKNSSEYEEGETFLISSDADNDDTMLMSSRGGDTEMFFDEDDNKSIILRDKNDSIHSFETSLSGTIIIGRSSDVSSLVIDYDKSISKKHCKIYMRGNDVYIEDLGSANKTYVNDVLVTAPKIIRTSDEIKIGRLKFSVTIK